MIKAVHVMHSYLAQSETFIWQYLSGFQRTHPVIVASSFQNLDQFPLPRGNFYTRHWPRFSLFWFLDNWYRRILKKPLGYIEKILQSENVKLMHAHFGSVGCQYLDISIALETPLITTFYGYDLSVEEVIESYRNDYHDLFAAGSHFLVEGPYMKRKLIALGCPEKKVCIQRIAINLDRYQLKEQMWDRQRPIRLLFVGRFVEKKGLEYAIKALGSIRRDYLFQLRVIGSGELEQQFRSLADKLGLAENILWLGMQPHSKVIDELRNSDILIQPSITAANGDSEGGAPTIILEAQACGIPVLSTYHADIPYITNPNQSALLSAERDAGHLTDNIIELFENSDSWASMGKKGREHVEKYHDVRKEVTSLEDIYTNCIVAKN